MIKKLKSKGYKTSFKDKLLLASLGVPLGLSICAPVYTGLELFYSWRAQRKEIKMAERMGNSITARDLENSVREEIERVYSQTIPPLIGRCNIHVSKRPYAKLPTYDPQLDTAFLFINSLPEDLIHEIGHKSYRQITQAELKVFSEMYEEYKRRLLIKEKKKSEKERLNGMDTSETFNFQGFQLPGEETMERMKKLQETKCGEEEYTRAFEKYYSRNVLRAEITKKEPWIRGDEEFRSLFGPFFESKYPKTTETIKPRKVTIISPEDWIESFKTSSKYLFYNFTLGPIRMVNRRYQDKSSKK